MKAVKADYALLREELDVEEDLCFHLDEDGSLASIEKGGSCSADTIRVPLILPKPSNAHIHSSDVLWPDVGFEMSIEELVSPPRGLKHVLLSRAGERAASDASLGVYKWLDSMGVGGVGDFKEPASGGCLPTRERLENTAVRLEVVLLGRPGDPYGLEGCDGIGLNSPLDVDPTRIRGLKNSLKGPLHAHVAEIPELRREGDLEAALEMGVDAIVHGTHLKSGDLDLLRDNGVIHVMSVRSNMWHSTGIPPVAEAINRGVRIAVGTDNAAWNTPDVWEEAYSLALVGRLQGLKDERLARAILEGLFVWGYRSLYREPGRVVEGVDGCRLLAVFLAEEELGLLKRSYNKYYAVLRVVRPSKTRSLCDIL
ncbi:MAG: amidohydrolase family protein [Aeropyrum sp.]|nr:amidohydrolase family protein [Aeropyrum sp.]